MIVAPPSYHELRTRVVDALGPDRKPLLIGLDGRDGHGKTSAACWLAWQLGMPAIYLDLFLRRNEVPAPIGWRSDDLSRCLAARNDQPIIIEGILLLDVMDGLNKSLDYLIFVEKVDPPHPRDRSLDDDLVDPREFALSNQVSRYFHRRVPLARADVRLVWSEG
jgi:uridine kinase